MQVVQEVGRINKLFKRINKLFKRINETCPCVPYDNIHESNTWAATGLCVSRGYEGFTTYS